MIRLTVSPEIVEDLFKTVKHDKFQESRHRHWRVTGDGSVRDQSVLWFFCWAENGDGSAETAVACEDIFNEIFAFSFDFFKSRVGYDYANRFRYSPSDYIEQEVAEMLQREEE